MGKVFSSVRKWIGNYLYFSEATFSIRCLVLSHSFVKHICISVLITYLTEVIWKPPISEDNYQLAAVAINMINGVSYIMAGVLACISNISGPFKVIAYTNAAYVLGLILLWRSSIVRDNNADILFFGAGVLLALGEAGRPAALGKFLGDQYLSEAYHKIKLPETNRSTEEEEGHISTRNEEQEDHISTRKEEADKQKQVEEEKQKRVETRLTALWNLPYFIGAAAPFALYKRSWSTQLQLSMILMGVSYLFFWYGVLAYSRNIKNDSNDPAVEDAPRDPGLCQAIKSLSASVEAPGWRFWLKPDCRKRYYKEMLVMCFAFIAYILVEATGSTFFFSQMNRLDHHIGKFEISNTGNTYFVMLQSLSSSIISFLWRLLIPKQSKRATLVRISCGLVCSVLCMVAAWQVEIRRNQDFPLRVSMSILWLVPQFTLLGFMRGLAAEGLIEFFADRVDGNGKRKARHYGTQASYFVRGIGTLLTAVSILGFRKTWLVEDINQSRLDKYYRALVFIGVANLCYYFCVAVYFYTKEDHSPISFAPDGSEQSETPSEDKKHYDHARLPDGAETPEPEEVKSSFVVDCSSCFDIQ